jgi:hypothetical protein
VTGGGTKLRRRELVLAGALAAGAVLAGDPPPLARAQGSADAAVVLAAVQLERSLSLAYAEMARRPRLGRSLRALLAELADHEARHADALLTLVEYIGAPPPPVPTLAAVEQALPGVRDAVDRPSALIVVDELERAELLGFNSDIQVLTDAKLIELVGAVMCSDAQHLALVRQAAGLDPIPAALETGNAR